MTDICVVDSVSLAVSNNWAPATMAVGSGSVITVHRSACAAVPLTMSNVGSGITKEPGLHVDTAAQPESTGAESEEADAEPIEQEMVSMCKAGYAVAAGKNIQVIADKLDMLAYTSPASFMKQSRILLQLQRVWSWVDRVESLTIIDPCLSLQNCGVLQLIQADDLISSAAAADGMLLETMPCRVYESASRKAARSVCGWAQLKRSGDTVDDANEARYLELDDLVEEYVKFGMILRI